MNHSGDAAEQIMRISFDGMEHVIRLTGAGAKQAAAFIMAAFKRTGTDDKMKLKGKERLSNMLKSGKELKVFQVNNSDLEQFAKEAKKYGVVYCALKDKDAAPDAKIDVMAKADDGAKISRIMEKLEFATVDPASIVNKMAEQDKDSATPEAPDRDDTDKLIDMLIDEEGKARTDTPTKAAGDMANPTQAGAERENRQSASRSKTQSKSAGAYQKAKPESVREFLRERTAQNNQKREESKPVRNQQKPKNQNQKSNQHIQPPKRGKTKITKER